MVNEIEDEMIPVEKDKFLQKFNELDEYGGTIRASVGVFDNECQLIGIYFSRKSYVKLKNQYMTLKAEVTKLRKQKKDNHE